MSPSVPRCGRLDPHEPHEWTRPAIPPYVGPWLSHTYTCPGVVQIEGGYDPEWAAHVAEQNADYWSGAPE